MNAQNKKIILLVLSVLVLASIAVWLSIFRESQMKPVPVVDRLPIEKSSVPESVLQPANPQDYGMVVFDTDLSLNEGEIKTLIHNKMQEIRSQFPEETLAKAKEAIKEDSQVTNEKKAKIDEAIAKCRQTLVLEPTNEEIRSKLRNLLILKSLAEEIPQ